MEYSLPGWGNFRQL